jgi:alkylhydroperoxidase family enzyme
MESTLTCLLRADAVPMATLRERYGTLLDLVRKLIGVVPNCDAYLEIWPPAFRTYNVMVPNFLNLPFSLWGVGAAKDIVGLSMYVASRTAACAYCSAHTASFALRRGARPDTVGHALDEDAPLTDGEAAAIAVARSLALVPAAVTGAEREALGRLFPPAEVEWIVLGIAMMGFLNKFMDAVGVELEEDTVGEVRGVISPSGWAPGKHLDTPPPVATVPPRADSLGTMLSVVPMIPSALAIDRKWTAGVPSKWPAVGAYLREHTGHDFPVLSRLQHGRAIRAVAVMVRDSLDAATSVIGVPAKCAIGVVYATIVGDAALAAELRALGAHAGVSPAELDEAARFAEGGPPPTGGDARVNAAWLLARAASPSPARIPAEVVDACKASGLSAAAVVEIVAWLSVLQMLHRLAAYYAPA